MESTIQKKVSNILRNQNMLIKILKDYFIWVMKIYSRLSK